MNPMDYNTTYDFVSDSSGDENEDQETEILSDSQNEDDNNTRDSSYSGGSKSSSVSSESDIEIIDSSPPSTPNVEIANYSQNETDSASTNKSIWNETLNSLLYNLLERKNEAVDEDDDVIIIDDSEPIMPQEPVVRTMPGSSTSTNKPLPKLTRIRSPPPQTLIKNKQPKLECKETQGENRRTPLIYEETNQSILKSYLQAPSIRIRDPSDFFFQDNNNIINISQNPPTTTQNDSNIDNIEINIHPNIMLVPSVNCDSPQATIHYHPPSRKTPPPAYPGTSKPSTTASNLQQILLSDRSTPSYLKPIPSNQALPVPMCYELGNSSNSPTLKSNPICYDVTRPLKKVMEKHLSTTHIAESRTRMLNENNENLKWLRERLLVAHDLRNLSCANSIADPATIQFLDKKIKQLENLITEEKAIQRILYSRTEYG